MTGIIDDVFERLSVASRQAFVRARYDSERRADGLALNSGHLVIGLAGRRGDQSAVALSMVGLSEDDLRRAWHRLSSDDFEPGMLGHSSDELVAVLQMAVERRTEPGEVTTGDLLLAVLDSEDSIGRSLIHSAGTDAAVLREAVLESLVDPDPPWVPEHQGSWVVTIDDEATPSHLRWDSR